MKPGERVRLIKEVAASLRSLPWSEIQLTFDEFGVPTYDRDQYQDAPDDSTYCMQQLQSSSSDVLMAIHVFLLGEDAAPRGTSVTDSDGLWSPQPARAFLSHIYNHRTFVAEVKESLRLFGIAGFVAHEDINPSRDWRNSIKAGLATCHLFVPFLDEGFHESEWCDQEVGWALARGIPILPVRPKGFDRTTARDGFLEERQDVCLDRAAGRSNARWVADQIFASLLAHSQTRDVGVKALAEAFVNSGSYDQTRRLWSLIELQSLIEGPQLRRLEYAVSSNSQIYNAVIPRQGKVPELVAALVAKFEPSPPAYDYGQEPF